MGDFRYPYKHDERFYFPLFMVRKFGCWLYVRMEEWFTRVTIINNLDPERRACADLSTRHIMETHEFQLFTLSERR